ncbi:MAG: hypothetical protein U0Z75_00230 [Deinococcaceae bacterium]
MMNIPSVAEAVQLQVNAFQRERLKRIDDFDYGPLAKRMKKELPKEGVDATDEYISQGIFALKQYYAVALLDPKNRHAIALELDPFWHTHILFTKEYVQFCDDVFGQYIHHVPLDNDDALAVDEVLELYTYTLGIYKQMFRVDTINGYWSEPERSNMVCLHQLVCNPIVHSQGLFPAVYC